MWKREKKLLGSKGVNIEQYLNIAGGSVNDLYSSPKYPGSPDYFGVFPSFESPNNSWYTVCMKKYF